VAGAIQDHDRGVIMGNETFGKGSVQTILPLERNKALKLTTAYYYTPSGRCINKASNEVGVARHEMEKEMEKLEQLKKEGKDTTAAAIKKAEFKTLSVGRTVYGGGGITPDVDVPNERYTSIEIELTRKSMFFKFAVSEVNRLKAKGTPLKEDQFQVTDQVYNDFISFCKEKKLEYSTPEQTLYKDLKTSVLRSRKDPLDTNAVLAGPNDTELDAKLGDLEKVIDREKEYAFTRYRRVVQDQLMLSFLSVGVNQDAYYRYALKNDRTISLALKLIKDAKRYDGILKKDYKKPI
jgi:carboxyl-terminal processing protease